MINNISRNFQHHIAHVPGHTKGMQVVKLEHLSYVDSGLPCDTFNIIHIHDGTGLNKKELQQALHHFRSKSSEFCIWITKDSLNEPAKDLLSKAGTQEQAQETGMILDLAGYTPRSLDQHQHIQVADTPARLNDYARVISENWNPPDQNVLAFYQKTSNAWLDAQNKMILLVYYDGDKAVSAVELCPSDEQTIGLYGFATLEAYRGRGIGSALMSYSLNLAKELGFQFAVLQATEDGIGIYKKMGFKEVTTFYEYA